MAALVAQGLSDKEIADRLGLRTTSVRVYLSRMYRKFGFSKWGSNRVLLTLWTLRAQGKLHD